MNRQKIVAHVLVKNEEMWIWYALMSVLDLVDEIMVWDTGSTDNTVKIIKLIASHKIKFRQVENTADETALSKIRSQMIYESKDFDWLLILDGDEIWPEYNLIEVIKFIQEYGHDFDSLIVPTLNCVGDVYHVSQPWLGKYRLAGRVGHLNLRFVNCKIAGLHVDNPEGKLQSYLDSDNVALQDRDEARIHFLDKPYLHMTHLTRSADRRNETNVYWRKEKKKYNLGNKLPDDFEFPKCFYYPHPRAVLSAFYHRSLGYSVIALWQTPLKKIKNIISYA